MILDIATAAKSAYTSGQQLSKLMAINKDKTRISVTLTKEEYALLKDKAKQENRSVSNLIGLLVKQYLRS